MITENDFQREFKRLVGLKQNQGKSEDELRPLARINLMCRDFHSNPMFPDPEEQKLAEDKYRSYLTNNELESDSDLDILKSLIFNEILEARIQKQFNEDAQSNKYPDEKKIKSLVEVQNQKSKLKVKLGIDAEDGKQDDLSAFQLLQKRVDKYINEHKNEFSFGLGFQCEECGHKNWETFLLYKRVKDFDAAIKHPWFLGRWLFNYQIIKDVKEKKLSAEDATRYLMCAGNGDFYPPSNDDKKWCTDYVLYLVDNWTEIVDLMNKNEK